MSNEWLNDLRRKMEDHTEDVPDGLWKNIRDELFADDEAKPVPGFMSNDLKAQNKAVKKFNFTPLYRICGIAAAIAMFFILGRLFNFNNDKNPSSKPKISLNEIQSDSQNTILSQKQPDLGVESFRDRNDLNNINSNQSKNTDYNFNKNILGNILNKAQNQINNPWENKILQNPDKIENILPQENKNLAQEQNKNLETQKTAEETVTHELLTKEEREWKEKFEDAEKKKLAKNNKKWMLGLGTGNASSNSSEQFPGYATLNGTTLSLPEMWISGYGEDPLMSILIANQNKKVDATIKHKTPITFGASALYNINKKWGIGLGVNYTRLSADLTTGSSDNFISSEQNIHYVGIPVQINYNVIQKGAFTGYVTGGTVIEKAVSGDIKTKYIVDGIVKEETTEEITEKPVQVSVNTALGLQLKVIKNIGIYAEPGVGYHFNDNSSLKTIYKEKPLNFNLKFGIRLLLD